MKCPTREQIETAVKAKGYKWFENGNYNLNIVGVRNAETLNEVTNKFDDHLTLSYKVDGEWNYHCFDCTTDPGKHWVENVLNESGVAILKENQYKGTTKWMQSTIFESKKHLETNKVNLKVKSAMDNCLLGDLI